MLRTVNAKVKNFSQKSVKQASKMCLGCGAILEKESVECPTCKKQKQLPSN
jgi:rubrerythrin